MATREEIGEGIGGRRETILNFIRAWGVIKHPYGPKDAEGCLAMLSDLGVVIKVDKELPCPECNGKKIIYGEPEKWETLHLCPTCEGNRFVAVEPLIEDK